MFPNRTHSLLRALADPRGPAAPLPSPSEPSRLKPLLELADWHGVLPAVIENLHGWQGFQPEPAAWDWAAQRLRHRAALSLLLRQQAQELLAHAQQAGLPVLVLKGCDFADRLYRQPSLRPFTDVDLLVPEAARDPLRQVLRDLGYRPVGIRMKHSTGYGEESWRRQPQPGGMVELHWNLVNSPSLRQGLSVRYEDLQLESHRGQPRPSAAATLLIAAVHGVASHGLDRLQTLVDVAQAARGMAGPLDESWLAGVAARTGAVRALALALALAGSTFKAPACHELQRRLGLGHQAWVGRLLVSRAVVLRAHASRDSFRRQLLREWLKRQ